MRKLALVFAGGFCGTLARYFLAAPLLALAALILPAAHTGFPWDVFAINLSGAFILGLLYGLAERGARIAPDTRLAIGTGFLGAYTTFSTFTYGGITLLLSGAALAGALYLVGSVVLGVACAYAGHLAAGVLLERRRLAHRARRLRQLALARRERILTAQPWRLNHRGNAHTLPGHTSSAHMPHQASHSGASTSRRDAATCSSKTERMPER